VNERSFTKLNDIINHWGGKVSNLIPILQDVQKEYRYLPEEVLTYVATALAIPPASVYGVATFYAQFSLQPKGKYIIKVCDGTACHVRGSAEVKCIVRKHLGLAEDASTTDDLSFTVEEVACLGCCGLAPVMTINDDEVHGQLTPEVLKLVLDDLLKRNAAEEVHGEDARYPVDKAGPAAQAAGEVPGDICP